MATSKNKVGDRFDNIVLVEDTGKRTKTSGGVIWKCKCDCGRTFERSIASIKYSIKYGHTVSCGCAQKRKVVKI